MGKVYKISNSENGSYWESFSIRKAEAKGVFFMFMFYPLSVIYLGINTIMALYDLVQGQTTSKLSSFILLVVKLAFLYKY